MGDVFMSKYVYIYMESTMRTMVTLVPDVVHTECQELVHMHVGWCSSTCACLPGTNWLPKKRQLCLPYCLPCAQGGQLQRQYHVFRPHNLPHSLLQCASLTGRNSFTQYIGLIGYQGVCNPTPNEFWYLIWGVGLLLGAFQPLAFLSSPGVECFPFFLLIFPSN